MAAALKNSTPRDATRFALPLAWLVLAGCLTLETGLTPAAPKPLAGVQSATYYVVAHRGVSLSLSAACLVFAAADALMSVGRVRVRQGLGWAQLVLALVGGLMVVHLPFWLDLGQAPRRYEDLPAAFQSANRIATAGYLLMALGLAVFLFAFGDWLGRKLKPAPMERLRV